MKVSIFFAKTDHWKWWLRFGLVAKLFFFLDFLPWIVFKHSFDQPLQEIRKQGFGHWHLM